MKNLSIFRYKINDTSKPFIIAEISSNHNWSLKHTLKLVKKIKDAGADAIKIQTYDENSMTYNSKKPDFVVQKGLWKKYSLFELYKEAKTPIEWHQKIFQYARSLGLVAFSTPFDENSVDFLKKLNVPTYKIASFELVDHPLIEYIAKKNKPIILSTGMSSLSEISEAVNVIKKTKNDKIILLHCMSSYPSNYYDYNLRMMLKLKKKFNLHVGLSDHTKGEEVAMAATALGAKIIEKHVKLKGDNNSHDSKFSMDTEELKSFCKKINKIWKTLGSDNFDLRKDKDFKKYRRSIYVVKDLKKNEKITLSNIKKIRPSHGLHPKYFYKVLGRRTKKKILAGTPLKIEFIK